MNSQGIGLTLDLFGHYVTKDKYHITPITYGQSEPYIMNLHYAHRMPVITYAYGLFESHDLVGVVTYGIPASPNLCEGIAGKEYKNHVIELNRLVLRDNKKNQASILISSSLKLLPKPKIVVSYADTDQKHKGVVYQATNFLFTGTTKERTDKASSDGNHARHNLGDSNLRQKRSAKHRYIYFHADKKQKKIYKTKLKYEIQPYPKS